MDEPESMGAITMPVREKLDNLIFVINCNLQRLDGPVRGNGKIIQELEAAFRGAGWAVIKVSGVRAGIRCWPKTTRACCSGSWKSASTANTRRSSREDGAYVREHFFGRYPELKEMVANMSDDDIWRLNRGGLDALKVYAAYDRAVKHEGRPVVILAKTVKGFGMGTGRRRQDDGAPDEEARPSRTSRRSATASISRFPMTISRTCRSTGRPRTAKKFVICRSAAPRSADTCRRATPRLSRLKGAVARCLPEPTRRVRRSRDFDHDGAGAHADDAGRTKNIGKHIVPIVPDEARTFGMEGMFRQIGIYSSKGQLYTPQDSEQLMYYREDKEGQILQEGINEGGAFCSWTCGRRRVMRITACTIDSVLYLLLDVRFSAHRRFHLGCGRHAGAAAFLIGGTAGRTTLAGEGLQHQDGHSLLAAIDHSELCCYDPAYAYELAVIIQDGMRRMYQEEERIFYYITCMNENYVQPAMPPGVKDGICVACISCCIGGQGKLRVQLFGAGTILREVLRAAEMLEQDFGVQADVWSVTSFSELRRDGMDCDRWNMRHPGETPRNSYVTQCLVARHPDRLLRRPIICASSPIRFGPWIPGHYVVLGTDGYGRSDSRRALRDFFEVDARHIVLAALKALEG